MSKSRKAKRNTKSPPAAAARRRFPPPVAIVLAVAVVAAGALWWSKGRHTDTAPGAVPEAAGNATNEPAPAATTRPEFEKLKGKWVRPDGGYIVEVRGVEPGGKMDVGYFNPRPINVSKAGAIQEGTVTKVFIELRDANYPGSTYTLAYEAASDQLKGIYYQAALQQQFEVVFMRLKWTRRNKQT